MLGVPPPVGETGRRAVDSSRHRRPDVDDSPRMSDRPAILRRRRRRRWRRRPRPRRRMVCGASVDAGRYCNSGQRPHFGPGDQPGGNAGL